MVGKLLPWRFHPYNRAQLDILKLTGGKVRSGPFAGQISILDKKADFIDPEMLLGLYEVELHSYIAKILESDFDTFIDVGSAQGYYVIGVALKCPRTRIVGFEISENAIAQFDRIAGANSVKDRIVLRNRCTVQELQQELQKGGRTCLLMDIDGGELDLLDPAAVPELAHTTMLIEEHSFMIPGLKETLYQRFKESHEIREIPSRLRVVEDLPSGYRNRYHLQNVNRRGGQQSWLWMSPRSEATPA